MPSTSRTSPKTTLLEIPLRGAGGEPVSFSHTIASHGLAALPPGVLDSAVPSYAFTARLRGKSRTLRFTESNGKLRVETNGTLVRADQREIVAITRRMFRLDDDLAPFYAMIEGDPTLAWARCGAGRMLASPTVFEDVIRTICTTNCAWSATRRMIGALVELGGGAFPSPELLAGTKERWFTDVAKTGYRGAYVRAIAKGVRDGEIDLESLLPVHGHEEEAVEEMLLALPGVGPYAAAHIMQLLGYHRRLILDSWTRPTFLRKSGKKRAGDATIRRTFARYGRFAGLAFWLYLTSHWHEGS